MHNVEQSRAVGQAILTHYGKKGMHWGVRRGSNTKSPVKMPGTRGYNPKKLSNEELKKVVARMELEQRYTHLNTKKIDAGEKKVKSRKSQFVDIAFKAGTAYVVKQVLSGESIIPKGPAKKAAEEATRKAAEEAAKATGKVGKDFIKEYQDFYRASKKKK